MYTCGLYLFLPLALILLGCFVCFLFFVFCFSRLLACSSATNNLIGAQDHASIQIDVAAVDKSTGVMIPDKVKSYVFCGEVRTQVCLFHNKDNALDLD